MPSHLQDFTLTAAPADAMYPVVPQVNLKFRPDEYAFVNESVDTDVYCSFDGVNDHIWLKVGSPLQSQGYESIERKVWFRRGPIGISGAAHVIVEASTDSIPSE
jgi:hypothetical protein